MNADDDGAPDPARTAAQDQRLAAMSGRLERHARTRLRGDVALACLAVAVIVFELAARPPVRRWDLVAALIVIALLAADSFVQGLMLRRYQAEVRDLRSRL